MTTIVAAVQAKLPRWLRKFQLSDLKLEELRADEIALEREEKKLEEALDKSGVEIAQITQGVVESGQKTKARQAVRKIMQLKDGMKVREAELTQVSQHLMALGRLKRIVENRAGLAQSGVLARLKRLPQATLQGVICEGAARRQLADEGLDEIADLLNLPVAETAEEAEDARQIREALEAAIDANDPGLVSAAITDAEAQAATPDVF